MINKLDEQDSNEADLVQVGVKSNILTNAINKSSSN